MNIGEEKRTIIVTPRENPVPQRQPARRERKFDPVTPTQPIEDPSKAPTKVPAP